jgi:hypothetical protein
MIMSKLRFVALALVVWVVVAGGPAAAPGFIGNVPPTLGALCPWPGAKAYGPYHIIAVKVDKVSKEKGGIIFSKVADYGKAGTPISPWPFQIVRQTIPTDMPQRQRIFDWAQPGKIAMMFFLDTSGPNILDSHTYIDNVWYASIGTGGQKKSEDDWWTARFVEPYMLRTYCGKTEQLQEAIKAILDGKEVVVPCLADGTVEELSLYKTRVQYLRASLKRLDYDQKRDFVRWAGADFTFGVALDEPEARLRTRSLAAPFIEGKVRQLTEDKDGWRFTVRVLEKTRPASGKLEDSKFISTIFECAASQKTKVGVLNQPREALKLTAEDASRFRLDATASVYAATLRDLPRDQEHEVRIILDSAELDRLKAAHASKSRGGKADDPTKAYVPGLSFPVSAIVVKNSLSLDQVAAHLRKDLGLQLDTSNRRAQDEKWLLGANGKTYFLTTAGQVYCWSGTHQLPATGTLVGVLSPKYWSDLGWLTGPQK